MTMTKEPRGSAKEKAIHIVTTDGEKQFNSGLSTADLQINTIAYGAIPDDGTTDNTAAVQRALDAAAGTPVYNPDGAEFDLSALLFPDNAGTHGYYVLDYRANDDTSSPTHPNSNVTNERIRFIHNNNASGYNSEQQFLSGYSTGLILDCRRDLDDQNLGGGQGAEYGRTSIVWRQDGRTRAQIKYTDSAGDTSSPGLDDGLTMQYIEPRQTLSNIKQSSFVATLAINDMVSGTTSGARGWVKAIGGSSITVLWLSGTFQTGETVVLEPNVETTTDTITTVGAFSDTSKSNRIGFSNKQGGNMFVNIQGDDAVWPANVGGVLGVQQSNTSVGSFTNAEVYLADDLGNVTQSVRLQLEASTGDAVLLVDGTERFRVTEDGSMTCTSFANPIATTTQLNDITHAINTSVNKVEGTQVFNVTTNTPVWAVGNTDGAVWVDGVGTTAHTPV